MGLSTKQKDELRAEIKLLINITADLLSNNKILKIGQGESPRDLEKIWQKISLIHIRKFNFNQATRIKNLWLKNTHNFADEVNNILKVIFFLFLFYFIVN